LFKHNFYTAYHNDKVTKMHGLLNIHIQFNNYSLDGIQFTIVLE